VSGAAPFRKPGRRSGGAAPFHKPGRRSSGAAPFHKPGRRSSGAGRKVLWLSDRDVEGLLSVEEAIPLVEAAFAALGEGRAQMPPKVYLTFEEFGGDLRAMPAYLKTASGRPYAGVKVVNSHPRNPERGLPTVAAVCVLNDPETGMPLAVLAAGRMTDIRTGAGGGVAAKYLARPGSSTVGLVGCGRQALAQAEALNALFALKEVRVAGRTPEEAEAFCRSRPADGPAFVPCESVRDACAADIVVTTTPSRRPVVKKAWIRPGTHINAIGADAPGKQELETALVKSARVVVDDAAQALHSGEVNVPVARGALKPADIAGELAQVVLGKKKGRRSDADVTVFDSTGLAVQDVAVAAAVYERAVAAGKGVELTL
jgi:alanine dehydrogenase